jgi:transcriptional regulator with XRE-family HTH domain
MNKIGNKIRQLREIKGLSQESIAVELGISQPSYARLEKKDERISITRLIELANVLKTSVSEIIEERTQKIISQQNCDNPQAYNVDTINTIINSDKEHIQTLKDEILYLRNLIDKS